MASNYPSSLDSFDTIASDKKTSDAVGGRTHRQMHNDLGDAVEAVQAELGTDPAGTFSTVKARLDQLVAYAAKTSAYTATVADHTLNVTSGTFTLDLPAASTCTGQSLKVKNSGTGVVTLDGNSSETVEGVATFPLGPGSYIEITSTGSAWILTAGVPDTGWRQVASWGTDGIITASGVTLTNITAKASTAGSILMRRVGGEVTITIKGAVLASGATLTGMTAGFVRNTAPYMAVPANSTFGGVLAGSNIYYLGAHTTDNSFGSTFVAPMYGIAWPSSLPGTAA